MLPCMGKKTVNFETFSWKGPEAAAAGWLAIVHADYRLWLPRMEMMSITREKFPEILSSCHTMAEAKEEKGQFSFIKIILTICFTWLKVCTY